MEILFKTSWTVTAKADIERKHYQEAQLCLPQLAYFTKHLNACIRLGHNAALPILGVSAEDHYQDYLSKDDFPNQ